MHGLRAALRALGRLAAVAALGLLLWGLPALQVRGLDATVPPDEVARLEDEHRRTLALILAGIVLGAGVFATWRRIGTAERQVELAREGQVTERLTRAVGQLGDREAVAVRLGGVYALERISRESPADHWTVMEVLCAYVRSAVPVAAAPPGPPQPLAGEVQAVLTVLGRRRWREVEPGPLDLRGTDLARAFLREAHLEGVVLEGARLEGADLWGAHLERARLGGADLHGASLQFAHLEEADAAAARLEEAVLVGASLDRARLAGARAARAVLLDARLEQADLAGADLAGANLGGTVLRGANLRGASCEGAHLREADLASAKLVAARLAGAVLIEANLREADLTKADLAGANLRKADLSGAWLTEAEMGRAELTEASLAGAHLQFARGLERGQVDSARLDPTTRLPADLEAPSPPGEAGGEA
ncbi:MAG: pentapeptide repeat-containing protein [Planctomycetes bacterium]|nr:pentapeptide repeat-containing protein [Planctomycetota bacterium]